MGVICDRCSFLSWRDMRGAQMSLLSAGTGGFRSVCRALQRKAGKWEATWSHVLAPSKPQTRRCSSALVRTVGAGVWALRFYFLCPNVVFIFLIYPFKKCVQLTERCLYTCVHVSVYLCVCKSLCVHAFVCVFECVYVCVCLCMCVYVYTCVCMCVHV